MTSDHTSRAAPKTHQDLRAAGFTAAQIDRLEKLGSMYPYIELFESRQELQRLKFMKWMVGRRVVADAARPHRDVSAR